MTRATIWSDFQADHNGYVHQTTGMLWPEAPNPRRPEPIFNADVLVMAGDMFVAEHFNDTEPTFKTRTPRRFIVHLLQNTFPQFKHVVYVPGNHEYYGGNLQTTLPQMRAKMAALGATNLSILNDDYVVVGDTIIYGTTLWSRLENIIQREHAAQGMNDYGCIHTDATHTTKLTPLDTHKLHLRSVALLERFLHRCQTESALAGKKLMVVSHHAPSLQSLNPLYGKGDLNPCYASNLESLILANPHINVWAHGHTHHPVNYTIGNTRIISNPHGMDSESIAHRFNPHVTIEL